MTALAQSSEEEGGYHPPSIAEFFPPAILFEDTPFELNRIMLIRLLMTALLLLFFFLALRRPQIVPRGIQNIGEIALDFVRINIAEEIMGKQQGRRFLPMLATIFFMVFALNISGVIPLLNIAGTSVVGVPLVLAVMSYIAFNYAGIKKFGLGTYLKNSLFPPGVPKALYLLLTPIEFVSTFVLRPFTLTVRLLANMLAGHLLLVLFFGATNYLLFEVAEWYMRPVGVLAFGMGFVFTLFEILVAFLQAYIFALLTAAYLDLSQADEH